MFKYQTTHSLTQLPTNSASPNHLKDARQTRWRNSQYTVDMAGDGINRLLHM